MRRRILLATLAILPAARSLAQTASPSAAAPSPAASAPADPTPAQDPRMAERSLGSADAKVVVNEWFSLTCSHCADFQKTTFPAVKAKLIDTGRVRYVWRDFPLDQVALAAAMISRALPAERYEAFITTLLATQDRWAFARNVNPTEELAKIAALAGMPRKTFDATLADEGLRMAILNAQDEADKVLKVASTPTFVINGRLLPGAVTFDAFDRTVTDAT